MNNPTEIMNRNLIQVEIQMAKSLEEQVEWCQSQAASDLLLVV